MIITTHMHHKFALLDGRKLITGSLNWTMTAVQSNKENVIVTEEPELVQPYMDEFNKLWEANDPAKLPPQTHNENNTMWLNTPTKDKLIEVRYILKCWITFVLYVRISL